MTKNIFGSNPEGGMKNGKVQIKMAARCKRLFMGDEIKKMEARDE
jgi:hypothetical protein